MTHDTRTLLGEIPDLFALLPLFAIPGTGGDDTGRGAGSPARPPLSLDVLDLTDTRTKPDASPVRDDYERDKIMGARRQGILPTLESWARLIDGEMWDEGVEHAGPAESATVSGEVRFLLEHLDWAERQRWFNELEADVNGMHRDLRRALREPEPTTLVCTVPGCGWGVVEMDGGSWFRCTGCGKSTSRIEAHRATQRMQPQTLKECAAALDVAERTLREAVKRRTLRHVAMRDNKTKLYTVQDANLALARSRLQVQERSA